MNLKDEFNRLTSYFDDGVKRVHDMTDDLGDRVSKATRTGRKTIRRGRRAMTAAEEKMLEHMRDNTAWYLAVGLVAVAFVALQFIRPRRPGVRLLSPEDYS